MNKKDLIFIGVLVALAWLAYSWFDRNFEIVALKRKIVSTTGSATTSGPVPFPNTKPSFNYSGGSSFADLFSELYNTRAVLS